MRPQEGTHLAHRQRNLLLRVLPGRRTLIWNLLKRAPDRIIAAVISQPSGWRKELPTLSYDTNMKGWGPELVKARRAPCF